MNKQSQFQKNLAKIIHDEQDIEDQVDDLPDEEGEEEVKKLPDKVEYETKPTHIDEQESDKYDDYVYVRSILYGLIERGTTALEGSIIVATESEHPRAYEVASSLMKNVSEMSKDLMALHDKMNTDSNAPSVQNNTQHNHYYGEGGNGDDVNNVLDGLDDEDK